MNFQPFYQNLELLSLLVIRNVPVILKNSSQRAIMLSE